MKNLLNQIDMTGSRVIGAITKELGMQGPKHHAIVLGQSPRDSEIYIAELMTRGARVTTFRDFCQRYAPNGDIIVEPNKGSHDDITVARRALSEVELGSAQYDLVGNNCESFANRAMHGHSVSNQVVNTALGVLLLIGFIYVLKNEK